MQKRAKSSINFRPIRTWVIGSTQVRLLHTYSGQNPTSEYGQDTSVFGLYIAIMSFAPYEEKKRKSLKSNESRDHS